MSFGILLASHGHFAAAAKESLEMIAGVQPDVLAVSLEPEMSLEQFEEIFEKTYRTLKETNEEVLVLCDIFGGTPFNTVVRAMARGLELNAFTGLSLPTLIDLTFARDIPADQIDERVLATHAQAMQRIVVKTEGVDGEALLEEDSDLDL